MQEINVKILNQRISSTNIVISEKLSKKLELNMECKARMKTSKDENDKKVLLNMELNISSKDEELKIELISDVIFELDYLPDDCDTVAEQKLVPMARENLLNSLDTILVTMGYNKMELSKKM